MLNILTLLSTHQNRGLFSEDSNLKRQTIHGNGTRLWLRDSFMFVCGLHTFTDPQGEILSENILILQVDISLSSIFQESLEHDEGFFGVGEEHQSAALNVIAVLFGKKESSFKHLFNISDENENENLQMDIEEILCQGGDFLNSKPSQVLPTLNEDGKQEECTGGDYKDEQEELKRDVDELFESLAECEACSQQQTIGASQGPSTMSSVTHGPLYKRRSVSRGSGGNTPIIPQSTENDIPDDRPSRSQSADLDLNLHAVAPPLSELHLMTPGNDLENSGAILNCPGEPNLVNSSFSETGSCLNSNQYDFDVFKSQTVPVVVVASGMDQAVNLTDSDVDPMHPKATFHWTLDDSNCQDISVEEPVSPLVIHPNHFGEAVEEPTLHSNSNSVPNLCFSFSQEHLDQSLSPAYGPEFSRQSETLEEPRSPIGLHLHQYGREGSEQPYSPMGPQFQQYRQMMDQTESPITRQLDYLLNDSLDHTKAPLRMGFLPIDEQPSDAESLITPMMQHLRLEDSGKRGPSLSSDDGEAEGTTG